MPVPGGQLPAAGAQDGSAPRLVFEAPAELAGVAERLRRIDSAALADLVRLMGLEAPGPPVRVILATEDSELAAAVPGWVAGYVPGPPDDDAAASAGRPGDVVVLFPARSPTYPNDSLQETLRHEIAHVLIDRAAHPGGVPRWFHEGLATIAGSGWGLDDRARLTLAMVGGERIPLQRLEAMFRGREPEVRRAYVLAGAFVQDLLQEHGRGAMARTFDGLRIGLGLADAFHHATGITLETAERRFWRRRTIWNRWVPVITSSATLWGLITVLALWAIRRRRLRSAAIRRRWEEEERRATGQPAPPHSDSSSPNSTPSCHSSSRR